MATNAERQAAFRLRMSEAGFVQANVWVMPHQLSDIREMAELLRTSTDYEVGPIRDTATGKLVRWRNKRP